MKIRDLIVKLSGNLYKLFESLDEMRKEERIRTYKLLKEANSSIEKILKRVKH